MTHAEIMALKAGPVMDALVAEALGWQEVYTRGGWAFGVKPGGRVTDDSFECTPCYSTSTAASYEAEDALPEDKRGDFGNALKCVVEAGRPWKSTGENRWLLAHASPLARCKALLMVLIGEKK